MAVPRGSESALRTSDQILVRAATLGERTLSVVRMLFCAVVLVRYLIVTRPEGIAQGWMLGLLAPGAAVVFSAFVVAKSRRGPLRPATLLISVLLDWVLCSSSLLTNVLWPWPSYPGIVSIPDIGLVYLIIVSSAFRFSPPATLLSGVLHMGSCGLLFALDYRIGLQGREPNFNAFSLVLLAGVGATALTLAMVAWTRRLVLNSALESVRSEQVRRTLDALMQEGHGMRSLLSAAKLNADRLVRLVEPNLDGEPRELLRGLSDELSELGRLAARSRERSFAALAAVAGLRCAELPQAAERVSRLVGRRYPGVAFDLRGSVGEGQVAIVGGEAAFERILLNLLVNACEGDGARGATNVEVRFAPRGAELEVSVADDGPGFAADQLGERRGCSTTKPNGTGIGLFLVARLMQDSGGSFSHENRPEGGACVRLSFAGFHPSADH
ncbi:MAG TPA: sensor histidine kinase [Polyangiaceae bacterium]